MGNVAYLSQMHIYAADWGVNSAGPCKFENSPNRHKKVVAVSIISAEWIRCSSERPLASQDTSRIKRLVTYGAFSSHMQLQETLCSTCY